MKNSMWVVALSVAASLAACGGSGTSATQAAAPASSANDQFSVQDATGIQTMTVATTTIPDYLDIPAQIEADPTHVVHVFPPAGGRIIEMRVRPWDWVKKGQTLALIESGDLSRAVADYHKALADSQVKQEQLARSADLYAHNAIALKDYQQAQADAQTAQAEVEATKDQIRVFGMDPEHASSQLLVAAPRAGVVLDVGASPGEFSNALAAPQPLCTIADISAVWAVGDIYENDLVAVKTGEPAQVTLNAYPGQKWSGRVDVVSDAVDPNTRTLHVRVVLPNPGTRLKPSMFGAIRLLRSSRQGILVPATAVLREGNAAYTFVSEGGGQYQRRSVTIGQTSDGSVEITSGLKAGETIVSQGDLLLRASSAGTD
ncbi:MAG TPA: efflux RND transporter periplasmic adaptor subunit [Candidatus Acidoferrales bacterium]|nr:efflux RND transporter periplasmic adaptor subunit [Candidatus Acidoferrales bacterium]